MKVNKFNQRVTECLQIDTSTTNMLNNDLDFSGGNTNPQFKFNDDSDISFDNSIDVFADNDYMYNNKLFVGDIEVQEYNSKENAENNAPIFND